MDPWEIVLANKGWIYKEAIRLARPPVDREDLFQFGLMTAYRSAQNYDPERVPHFIPYCARVLKAEMYKECRKLRCQLRVPFSAPKEEFFKDFCNAFRSERIGERDLPEKRCKEAIAKKKVVGIPHPIAQKICEMVIDGKRAREIADELGLSGQAVGHYIKCLTRHYLGRTTLRKTWRKDRV